MHGNLRLTGHFSRPSFGGSLYSATFLCQKNDFRVLLT